jgi:hypothetical protein
MPARLVAAADLSTIRLAVLDVAEATGLDRAACPTAERLTDDERRAVVELADAARALAIRLRSV